jgi:hypothetical protein
MATQKKLFELSDTECRVLRVLALCMGTSEVGVIRRLLTAAVADSPEIRDAILADFRARLEEGRKVPA